LSPCADSQSLNTALATVLEGWRGADIDCLICGREGAQKGDRPSRLRILIQPGRRLEAEGVLLSLATSVNFKLINRVGLKRSTLCFAHPQTVEQFQIELSSAWIWNGIELLSFSEIRAELVAAEPDELRICDIGTAMELVEELIAGKAVGPERQELVCSHLLRPAGSVFTLLRRICGSHRAQWLADRTREGNWMEIEKVGHKLRSEIKRRRLKSRPLRTLGSWLFRPWGWLQRASARPGITVVLSGADGCGKSTAGKILIENLAATFPLELGRHFHWKPPVLSAKRRSARGSATDPHGLPTRGRVKSLLFFAAHWTEFLLGAPLRIWPATYRGGFVLIDRYFYDFFVDQRRFQLNVPMGLVRLACGLLPKPELVFVLDAPTEVLRARKQEVSFAETDRQRQQYVKLAARLPNGKIIDGTQPPAAVAQNIQREIFQFLAARQKRRDGLS